MLVFHPSCETYRVVEGWHMEKTANWHNRFGPDSHFITEQLPHHWPYIHTIYLLALAGF